MSSCHQRYLHAKARQSEGLLQLLSARTPLAATRPPRRRPRNVMNSRRLTIAPEAQDRTHRSGSNLYRERPQRMSALGHKRTYAVQKGMSALPPKANINGSSHSILLSRCSSRGSAHYAASCGPINQRSLGRRSTSPILRVDHSPQ
jgi:hypothetical protein